MENNKLKIYFMGSYVAGRVNIPRRDPLGDQLDGNLQDGVQYYGTKIDKSSRIYKILPKIRKDLKEADVLFLHPGRMDTSYFEIREALNLGREIWMLTERDRFESRGNYPYTLPNFKYISMDALKPLLAHQKLEELVRGLAERVE